MFDGRPTWTVHLRWTRQEYSEQRRGASAKKEAFDATVERLAEPYCAWCATERSDYLKGLPFFTSTGVSVYFYFPDLRQAANFAGSHADRAKLVGRAQ